MPRAFRSLSSFATVALCVAGALLAPRAIAQDAPPSPSPQQQSLARLVGDWDLEATFFDNGKPIAKMQMQEHVESVCGGLFLLSRVDGDMGGKKLQGYTLKGWNAFSNRIEGVEVDSMGGPPARSVGNVDLETGVITWTLTVTDNAAIDVGTIDSFAVTFGTTTSNCSFCPACAADFNQDGGVDGADVSAFFPEWENAGSCADVNLDGGIDGGDIDAFFTAWENGGC
jgi:hypothetical protein